PLLFKTDLTNIPGTAPYLWTASNAAAPPSQDQLQAGLAWAGSPRHNNDRNRSIKLSHLIPLGSLADVQLHSLQAGPAAQQARDVPQLRLVDHAQQLHDFADTAAIIAALDLVITVDTVVAHLAGAMGKPTWVLLPFAPDWRWLTKRDDSPWYPSMRLFR